MKVLFGFQAEQNNYKDIAAEKLGVIYPGKPTINTSTGMDSNNQKVAPNAQVDTTDGLPPDSSAD